MANTRYKRGSGYAADMAAYTREMAEDNSQQLDRLKENLARALRQDITDRQRLYLQLYYDQGLTMPQIASRLGVNKSTVSRTIHRGEDRLRRCLRYSDHSLLEEKICPETGQKAKKQENQPICGDIFDERG